MTKPLETFLYPEALKLAARKKKKKGLLFRVMHVNHSKRMGTLLRMVRRRLFQNQKKGRGREEIDKTNVGCKGHVWRPV